MNDTATLKFSQPRKASPIGPILGALVVFIFLWRMDFPKPMWDDMFYTGSAVNMAQGGDFSNPLLARQGFPSHYYFVYPPLHPFAVYSWLSVFGLSASSMVAFQELNYFIIALMMILLLWKQNAPGFYLWMVTPGITAVFLKAGLRPEAFSVALSMAGFTLLDRCRKPNLPAFLSILLLFLGAMAAPRTGFFSVALFIAGVWQKIRESDDAGKESLKYGALTALAVALTVLIFGLLIQFRFKEFAETFHFHAQRLNASRLALLRKFMLDLGVRWYPLFALTLAVLCLAYRQRREATTKLCYLLGATFLFSAMVGGLGPGSGWYAIFILLVLAPVLFGYNPRALGRGFQIVLVALLLFANSTKAIEVLGLVTGKIDQSPPQNKKDILAINPSIQHPLVVDPAVCRYVYDYRLPPGLIDFGFAAPFPAYAATDAPLLPDDIFVLGAVLVDGCNREGNFNYPVESWSIFGLRNWTYPKHQCQSFIIPASEVKIPRKIK